MFRHAILRSLIVLMLTLPALSFAEIYRYTDDKGALTITNDKDSIPEKHRNKAEVVRLKEPAAYNAPAKGTLEHIKEAPEKIGDELDSMFNFDSIKTWLILAAIGTLLTTVILCKTIKETSIRLLIAILILSCMYLVMGSVYMQRVMKRGNLKEEIEKVKTITQEKTNIIDKFLENK